MPIWQSRKRFGSLAHAFSIPSSSGGFSSPAYRILLWGFFFRFPWSETSTTARFLSFFTLRLRLSSTFAFHGTNVHRVRFSLDLSPSRRLQLVSFTSVSFLFCICALFSFLSHFWTSFRLLFASSYVYTCARLPSFVSSPRCIVVTISWLPPYPILFLTLDCSLVVFQFLSGCGAARLMEYC